MNKDKPYNTIKEKFIDNLYNPSTERDRQKCWGWRGPRSAQNSPLFDVCEGFMVDALHFAVTEYLGYNPQEYVTRTCKNIDCVNPNHANFTKG